MNSAFAYPATKGADNGSRRVMMAYMWLRRGEVPRLESSFCGDIVPESQQHTPRNPAALDITQQKTNLVVQSKMNRVRGIIAFGLSIAP